jgi:hypothetical protein
VDTCYDAPRPQRSLRAASGVEPRRSAALAATGAVIGREVDRVWQRGVAGRVLVVVSVLSFALWAAGMGLGLVALLS